MRNLGRSSQEIGHDLSDSDEDYPLANHIINATLPRFKMPSLERYDGSGDQDDHIRNYKTTMKLHAGN